MEEINHLDGISQSNSDLHAGSQLVHTINCSSFDEIPISYWNDDIHRERESNQKAEAPELQSQDQYSHSVPQVHSTPTRDVAILEDEQSLHHSWESFDNP